MGQVYQLGKARRQAPPLALPKSLLAAAETFGFDLPRTFDQFILRRCKEGTTVFIKGGRLTLNLSHATKVYPENFTAAIKLAVELFKNSVEIPGPEVDALCAAARDANAYVVIGACEKMPNTTGRTKGLKLKRTLRLNRFYRL